MTGLCGQLISAGLRHLSFLPDFPKCQRRDEAEFHPRATARCNGPPDEYPVRDKPRLCLRKGLWLVPHLCCVRFSGCNRTHCPAIPLGNLWTGKSSHPYGFLTCGFLTQDKQLFRRSKRNRENPAANRHIRSGGAGRQGARTRGDGCSARRRLIRVNRTDADPPSMLSLLALTSVHQPQ